MARGKTLKVVFKTSDQHQSVLLPLDLSEMIALDHPVRVVNEVLDKVNISALLAQYKPGGTSSYHPRMLLKVLVYAYINNIYSSRKIEQELAQNIHFLWLSALNKPDHNTISRFRSNRLQQTLKPIFTQVVVLLCEEGLLSIKELYTDGTKIEANANRYTFVWGNAIRTSRERIKTQLDELWQYAQSVAASELEDTDPSGFDPIDGEKVAQTIEKINEALKDKPVHKDVRQKLGYAQKHWPAALQKYEQQEKIIGEKRNSYSKTDPDATFMRLKEDHMKNGQLKPAYNVQISTNHQFIACYSIHQNPSDTNTLIDHVGMHIKEYKQKPSSLTADAGYGSEENYQWLEQKRITAYVKHQLFDRNQRQGNAKHQFDYEEQKDQYLCPAGKVMKKVDSYTQRTKNGYEQNISVYQTSKCAGCPLQQQCNPGQEQRSLHINHNKERLVAQAEQRLKTKRGMQKRKQRCCDTEPVFANIKHNHGFKRFLLRGINKVNVEMGLVALAHNLRKKIA
ncbi:IS1182 family transposase [Chitinophagaceae bacterium LB-8]|uniref:IS1182 family transposase n=1 Tax=Paraflavisolibacter caeni TaxID=2982496 RepID=A0A9X2XP91_9BACT|nr:IS1182 family transposase [Paraflavisolibacter caeni]MCU7550274.1 IS1182 family transposase [Paraflavisolibacter caeni]